MANDIKFNGGSFNTGNVGYSGPPQPTPTVEAVGTTQETRAVPKSTSSSSASGSNDSEHNATKEIQTLRELKNAERSGVKISPGDDIIIKAIAKANKAIEGRYTTFEFSVHEKTKQISIKVKDKDTGELIREIPPEKTLDMVARLWEMAGIIVDEKR